MNDSSRTIMPHAEKYPPTGLQALILCGPGSSFPTFTSSPDENPKALLPIANRPMVWYPIDFCYRTGINTSEAIKTGLNTDIYLTSLPLPRPDVLAPKDLDHNMGTAEILRLPEVKELVDSDFVILPCDLVCEVAGSQLLQAWQVKSGSLLSSLEVNHVTNGKRSRYSRGMGVWYDTKANTPIKKEETDFIATTSLDKPTMAPATESIIPGISKLVYSTPSDTLKDVIEESSGLPIRHGLLKAHPRVRMLTKHRDAHIYIFPRWVLEFVEQNERMESISEDVVGWWAKASWQRGLAEKLHVRTICQAQKPDADSHDSPTSENSQGARDLEQALWSRTSTMTMGLTSQQLRRVLSHNESQPESEVPNILAYVHSGSSQKEGSLVRRVDTAQLLLAISLQLARLPSLEETGGESVSPYAHARKVAYPEGVKSRTTITKQDSLVGENVTIEEKVAIKESVIGTGCQINEGAKISGCLLMDGVVVGKNCKLTKCILGKRCVIGDGSILTDCEVQENLLVEAKTEDKDNRLMSSEGLEATEAEMDEVLQDQDAEADDAVME
ncbi:Translation initiation factor subunit gamma-like protein [Emericellopsis cladophorae]|uniref:Translation initiation factor eIF2B subunit gamma n=1 Tax=Emericellopsis cladophorae TaxID=2686198 RepID=A0A9P9XWB2_9HYPO|nr:Translation initiation factor subunit gamma-like protein [Emericellopsis cladophorae]KAI6778620.1 Translation initiation factor subunit gamma-like protein [Emericellopsis cladophorae]